MIIPIYAQTFSVLFVCELYPQVISNVGQFPRSEISNPTPRNALAVITEMTILGKVEIPGETAIEQVDNALWL